MDLTGYESDPSKSPARSPVRAESPERADSPDHKHQGSVHASPRPEDDEEPTRSPAWESVASAASPALGRTRAATRKSRNEVIVSDAEPAKSKTPAKSGKKAGAKAAPKKTLEKASADALRKTMGSKKGADACKEDKLMLTFLVPMRVLSTLPLTTITMTNDAVSVKMEDNWHFVTSAHDRCATSLAAGIPSSRVCMAPLLLLSLHSKGIKASGPLLQAVQVDLRGYYEENCRDLVYQELEFDISEEDSLEKHQAELDKLMEALEQGRTPFQGAVVAISAHSENMRGDLLVEEKRAVTIPDFFENIIGDRVMQYLAKIPKVKWFLLACEMVINFPPALNDLKATIFKYRDSIYDLYAFDTPALNLHTTMTFVIEYTRKIFVNLNAEQKVMGDILDVARCLARTTAVYHLTPGDQETEVTRMV
ncbi:hypothetical protein FA95DRAFT_1577832 [Auriscalpium vulgare]|uniref:Uncharacterized protein n=1 Tax=Auriscalpium vulgare TaxID=40419 RepID=A0ACB8R521_9AGAM|nr:hypothetical protein FA95DRAFT_1577832 [Auriscalpium vulgare]